MTIHRSLKPGKLFPYSMAILAMMCWGMTFVWTKQVLGVFEPITVLLFRLIISSIILWVFILSTGLFQRVEPTDRKQFLFTALFSPFLYFIGETFGLKYVSPTVGAVIITTIPVVTPIGARVFLKERLGWINLLGLVISFAGVMIIIFSDEIEKGATITGILFLAFAVLVSVGYTVFVKRLTERYNSFTIVTMQNTIGILYFLPLYFIMDHQTIMSAQPGINTWLSLVALAVFGSTLAFLFFTNALRILGANRSSVFTNLIPVFTAFFAWVLLGESLSWIKVAGIGVVITGVLFVQLKAGFKLANVYRLAFRKK